MRIVAQRVSQASVRIDNVVVAEIGRGTLALVGVSRNDSTPQAVWCADKLAGLRIFPDDTGKMARSLADVGGSMLVVSQFTLYGRVRRGLRPDFGQAAPASLAEPVYKALLARLHELGVPVQTGHFGAHMEVQLTNDGPVTLAIDTDEVMPDGI